MTDIWFVSDTHFNHANILTFKDEMGNPVRSFKDVTEMNETMITNWNNAVKPRDKVYHLGDVAFGNVKDFHPIMKRLNGHKRLVMGNHDKFDVGVYGQYFDRVYSWRQFKDMPKKFIACHYPLHASAMFARHGGKDIQVWNVHGHVHNNSVKKMNKMFGLETTKQIDDPMYINVCVEKTNYAPIHIDAVMELMK